MIYIKNIRDIQEVFIPRTELDSETYIVTNKTYENGFIDGKSAGIELQKSKLTNLVVSENGLYERENGWNRVEVNVIGDAINTQEKSVTVTKDIEEVFPDEGYDALSKVDIDATEFGNQKHLEGYNEGYNIGKIDGREDVNLIGFDTTPSWEKRDENNRVNYNASEYSADGFSSVTIDIGTVYAEGHFQGKTEGYEGGKADGIEEGYNDGYTDGKTDGIEEGYNQGYADGKSESGSCNLIPLFDTPNWEGDTLLYYYPNEYNADGFSSVGIQISNIYNEAHNQGYNQGKSVGVEEGYQNGFIQGKTEGYTEGYQNGKADGGKIKIFDYGVNIQNSKFTTIPEWMDFEGVTDFGEAFRNCEKLTVVNDINTDSATSMRFMFWNCKSLETVNISAPNATTMESMFEDCTSLKNVTIMNSSNVTNMTDMFKNCWQLTSFPLLTTNKALQLGRMFDGCVNLTSVENLKPNAAKSFYCTFRECTKLSSIPALNASNLEYNGAELFGDTDLPNLTNFGGLVGLKMSSKYDEGFVRTPNLTYQSCINILNGLYDFIGNNDEIDPIDEGTLKVHPNFIALVGDQISIATNKGWTIISD